MNQITRISGSVRSQQMMNDQNRVAPNHSRAGIAHNSPNFLAHLWRTTMDYRPTYQSLPDRFQRALRHTQKEQHNPEKAQPLILIYTQKPTVLLGFFEITKQMQNKCGF